MEQVYKQWNNGNNQQFWNLEDYIIMVIISCFLKTQNEKILKFHLNNYTYFEVRAALKSFKVKYASGGVGGMGWEMLTRGNTVLVISRLTCLFLAKQNQGFFVFFIERRNIILISFIN